MFPVKNYDYKFNDGVCVDNLKDGCFGDFVCVSRGYKEEEATSISRGVLFFTDNEKEHGILFDLDKDISSVSIKPDEHYLYCIKEFSPVKYDESVADIIKDMRESVSDLFGEKENDDHKGFSLSMLETQHRFLIRWYNEYECHKAGFPPIEEFYDILGEFCYEMTRRLREQYKDSVKPVCKFDYGMSNGGFFNEQLFYDDKAFHFCLKVEVAFPKKMEDFHNNVFEEFCRNSNFEDSECVEEGIAVGFPPLEAKHFSIWEFHIHSLEDLKKFKI